MQGVLMQTVTTIIEKQPQIIRPELNIERWPIWMPSQSRGKLETRIFSHTDTRGTTLEIATVEVSPNLKYGNLTTEDEKVWYGLIKLWEDAGKPTELVFSLRKLAEVLGRRWGIDTHSSLKKSLHRLKATYFVWTNSYVLRHETGKKETKKLLEGFNLLSLLKIAEKEVNNQINKEACKIRFHELIESNLRNNYTKPTNLSTIIRFKSGITLLLYKHLEWMLYKRDVYIRSSKELFDDLRLEGAEYNKPSVRKRLLEKSIVELSNNVRIYGLLLKVSLQRSKHDEDWLLIAEKTAQLELALDDTASGVTATPSNRIEKEAEEMVKYFLDRFASIRRSQPQNKEIDQARALLDTHKLETVRARQFIDYAKEQANDTGFDVRNFGGILQYVERWFAYQQQARRVISGVFTPKQCTKCQNSSGFIYVIDTSGSRRAMKCPHNEEILATKAQEEHFTIQIL
jgi:Replication initiator protein A